MKNQRSLGQSIHYVAPVGGLTGGDPVLVGELFGVVVGDVDAGSTAVVALEGEFSLPKVSGTAITQGQALYWDAENEELTPTFGYGRRVVAIATAAAGSSAATVYARLINAPSPYATPDVITVTAPVGGVSAGDLIKIGEALVGVCAEDADAGDPVPMYTRGVFTVSKVSAEAITLGDAVYWDSTDVVTGAPAAGEVRVGTALATAGNPSSTVQILLGSGAGEPFVVDTDT